MTEKTHQPTSQIYNQIEKIYCYFNQKLFENQLPPCLFILKHTEAYTNHVSFNKWNTVCGQKTHELTLKASLISENTTLLLCQNIVHAQCHIWQKEFGNPSRPSYHNKQWADKMESIGLMPSAKNGNRTGQKVTEEPIDNGLFMNNYLNLSKEIALEIKQTNEAPQKRHKLKPKHKYKCEICNINIWGKPNLKVNCGKCNSNLILVRP